MAMSFQTGAEPVPGYKVMDRLGSGGFGEVWKCEAPGGIFKAMKVIHGDLRQKDSDAYRFAEQELKALKRVKMVRHPYLLALDRYDIVDGRLVITMELADCNLWERFRDCRAAGLEGIPRDELLQYMSETAEVLDLMYEKHQLQHLDIKPQNLFLVHNHVKVADFGQVKDLEGLVASVTGGITPVYAAPETFDGYISRYCDQYSLACVYQELLTGIRPFDGVSMQQLLMQHLQAAPNLKPSPEGDRPALARALSKKPEDRFPSVMAMVQAIRAGSPAPVRIPAMAYSGGSGSSGSFAIPDLPAGDSASKVGEELLSFSTAMPSVDQSTGMPFLQAPIVDSESYSSPAPERTALPEQTGPGPIRPALVVGLGHSGYQVLRHFRKRLDRDFGEAAKTPAVRSILIDTDEDALLEAQKGFPSSDMVPAKLNRAAHYLRPRANGRTVIEGWFDSKILHKLPRSPLTMGYRALGRLAFCDHYRTIMQKFEAELEACSAHEAISETCEATGKPLRTNQPRVYIVAGLSGGTGSGMFLDLAYSVKARMRRLGYANPEVVGILLVPPDAPKSEIPPQALANTYAALTELYHFGNPDTVYTASFDDRHGNLRDTDAPFSRVVLMPGLEPASESPMPTPPASARTSGTVRITNLRRSGTFPTTGTGSVRDLARSGTHSGPGDETDRDAIRTVAEFLRYDLLTPVGRRADENRPEGAANTASTFGMARMAWPRARIVERAARIIAPVLLNHWVAPDAHHVREIVPKWAQERFHALGLGHEVLAAKLLRASDGRNGFPLEDRIRQITEPLVPKGWLARVPESERIAQALDQLTKLIGPPRDGEKRPPSLLEMAVGGKADEIRQAAAKELSALFPALVDAPDFRFAGTEEAIRQVLIGVQRTAERFDAELRESEPLAVAAYDRLAFLSYPQKGGKKATAAEFGEAIQNYPHHWLRALVARHALGVFAALQETLSERLTNIAACRQKAHAAWKAMAADAERPVAASKHAELLPPGCVTAEDAAQKFIKVLTDEDLNEVERRVQEHYHSTYNGVYEACVNSVEGPDRLSQAIFAISKQYLDERLGSVAFDAMLTQRFGSNASVAQALLRAYYEAEPKLVSGGMWERGQLALVGHPDEATEATVNRTLAPVMPQPPVGAPLDDELLIYREYTGVPLAALPQFGPNWATAYQTAPEILQLDPHVRIDVTQWLDIDVDRNF
jgi:serine/threonine protein kinase